MRIIQKRLYNEVNIKLMFDVEISYGGNKFYSETIFL